MLRCKDIMKEIDDSIISQNDVTKLIPLLFPSAKGIRKTENYRLVRIMEGVELVGKENIVQGQLLGPQDLLKTFPPSTILLDLETMQVGIPSQIFHEGNLVLKVLTLRDNTWELTIRNTNVNLASLGISNEFQPTMSMVHSILRIVNALTICCGKQKEKGTDNDLRDTVREELVRVGGHKEKVIHRSKKCQGVVKWYSNICANCTHKRLYRTKWEVERQREKNEEAQSHDADNESNVLLQEADSTQLGLILDKCLETTQSDHMKLLLESQRNALRTKKGYRWSPEVLKVCLAMYIRSNAAYETMRSSDMLVLPSGKHLARIKNKVKQRPGIIDDALRWMHQSAVDAKVPERGFCGGLIHDEMKVQEDLVIKMSNGIPELVGWIDTGEIGNNLRILKDGEAKNVLATEVIQVSFLGYTGFRFPICHHPTNGAKVAELHTILYEVMAKLHFYRFDVDFILMDGGSANRTFIKSHFNTSPYEHKYITLNVTNPQQELALSQDCKHNSKKLRNGILKSGDNDHCTRSIVLHGKPIQWQMWIDAVKWDRQTNARLICHHITDQHLYPSQSEKMRNGLAEQMLDKDFLYLMKVYQASFVDGSVLDSAVMLLEQTSVMIEVFNDNRPITHMSDDRLVQLRQVLEFFKDWRCATENPKSNFSTECLDDVENVLLSFPEVCRMHLRKFPNGGVVPARYNSDVIENHFCQTRSLNGANNHPTYATYCHTVNSVILAQSSVSSARKSNAGLKAANPYNACMPSRTRKKKKSSNTVE